MGEQDIAGPLEVVLPAVAAGVVEADDKVRLRRSGQALLDLLPGGQQVAEGDDRKIVGQRRPQHRSAAAGGGDAGHHLDVDGRILLGHLVDEAGHAVDPGIPGADHGDMFSVHSGLHRGTAAVHLFLHAGGLHLLVRERLPNKVNIGGVAHHQVRGLDGVIRPAGEVPARAGAQTHNSQFHWLILLTIVMVTDGKHHPPLSIQKPGSMATATVTPFPACLGTVSRPPERTAARSQTLSTPVTPFTKSEGVKSPLAFCSSSAV